MSGASDERCVVGVIGRPISHSLSPTLHQAAFDALGLDWTSVAFEVGTGGGAAAIEAMRALGIRGLSVTMPLKAEVADAADELEPAARALESVNCLTLRGSEVVGASTDGEGLVAAIRYGGHDVTGAQILVVGSGGAARSVSAALGEHGAASVLVVARDQERAAATASLAGSVGAVGAPRDAATVDIVIEATPVGMAGTSQADQPSLVDPLTLHAGQLAVDLVYEPLETPWLLSAAQQGCEVQGGLGMLVHQAAGQIERWTGLGAPTEEMWSAARAAVEARTW